MGKIFTLDPDAIEALLATSLVGRIACCDHSGDGRPFLVPLAYGYDGEAAYAFSTPGRKIHIMRAQPLVTFEVDDAKAEDRWSSVIAEGVFEELTSEEDRDRAMLIIAKGGPVPEITPDHVVYRISFTSKSGRFEVPDEEAAAYM
jgi:nitroimidazol reductase NimA-like FMN-containing flavoprotein (pyridoxamine 5'-phosphate oxidase superfamily)